VEREAGTKVPLVLSLPPIRAKAHDQAAPGCALIECRSVLLNHLLMSPPPASICKDVQDASKANHKV
jgi:hypothetical protein